MKLDTITELYQLISRGTENTVSRKRSIELRKQGFKSILSGKKSTKLENINKLAESKIHDISSKDKNLENKYDKKSVEITNHDVASKTYDTLMEKLFSGIIVTKDNP